MTQTTFASNLRWALLLVATVSAWQPEPAHGQTAPADKLSPVLQALSRQIDGRSRVIVQFHGTSDARVITGTGGVAGRQLESTGAQVANLDNRALADIGNLPR